MYISGRGRGSDAVVRRIVPSGKVEEKIVVSMPHSSLHLFHAYAVGEHHVEEKGVVDEEEVWAFGGEGLGVAVEAGVGDEDALGRAPGGHDAEERTRAPL